MTALESQLYLALLPLCKRENLITPPVDGFFRFQLTEADVASLMAALGAYEDTETVERLGAVAERFSQGEKLARLP